MLAKIYLYTWLFFIAVFLLMFLNGGLSLVAWTVFGFIAFGLVFMGMIGVLPVLASHPPTENMRPAKAKKVDSGPDFEIAHSTLSVRV
jgi:hypothetical protein